MAKHQLIESLKKSLAELAAFKDKELISRSDWGAINFKDIQTDVEMVCNLVSALQSLPVEYLPENALSQIVETNKQILPQFQGIDAFSLTSNGDPNSRRSNLITHFHTASDNFYSRVGLWIPFLAYQKGDIAENIKRLTSAIDEAEVKADASLSAIAAKEKEAEDIITRAREASADAGVAVFTQDFQNESDLNSAIAKKWLWATIVFAGLTLVVAILLYFFEDLGDINKTQLISKLASKVIGISVLFTATMWCGKIYKSLRHLSIVNKHRAIGLRTFRAFSSAASDTRTKDAVLMETTHSIFANSATGLVTETATDSDANIIQIAGKVMDHTSNE